MISLKGMLNSFNSPLLNLTSIKENYNTWCNNWIFRNDISYKYEKGYKTPSILMTKSEILEYKTFNEIKFIDGFQKILDDILINIDDIKSSQIDLVGLHSTGIYVIECKNTTCTVSGNYSDKYWDYSNDSRYSPLYQNNSHINVLKDTLGIYDNSYFNSIIVFGDKSTIKLCNNSCSEDFYNPIITTLKNIRSCIYKITKEKDNILSTDELIEIYKKLSDYSRPTPQARIKHIEYIKKIRN